MVNSEGRKDIFNNFAIFTRRFRLLLVLNFLLLMIFLHLRTQLLRILFIFAFSLLPLRFILSIFKNIFLYRVFYSQFMLF